MMRRLRHLRPSVLLASAAAIATLSVGAGACSAARPGISNGSVTVCYRAIPAARAAVHASAAQLVGVHRLSAEEVRSRLRQETGYQLLGDNDTSVCAVSFQGKFTSGEVEMSPPGRVGRYAVVLVSSDHLRVLGGIVVDRLPQALGRRSL
jgi:hypothetical protein